MRRRFTCLALLLAATAFQVEGLDWKHGVVASGDPKATEAGVQVLKTGGNAVDAAVAIGLTLGVVDAKNSGIGGGCFILIRRPNGECVAIDGREMAPSAAHKDMFLRDGKAAPNLSQTGPLASGIPGALAAYAFANEHFGRRPFKELIQPAARLAATGFRINRAYARELKNEAENLRRFAASKELFFRQGRVLRAGEVLKQPDLAATYDRIAAEGVRWFYDGPFATATAKWMNENGGLLTADDFRRYRVIAREPLVTSYRGYKVIGFPPPSSGGVHVAEMLNILSAFDLRGDAGTCLHLVTEAMKLAFADRAHWLGDADFVDVPAGLVNRSYGLELARKIDPSRALPVPGHGVPPHSDREFFKRHTTHFSVADAEGNWVACTATLNTSFGSKVVIPGTGVVLNNQMDDFAIAPGVTNYFGLIGAEANSVAPGKRPLSSMSPTIVTFDNQPILALGAAGGPRIITQVLLELIDMLDLGMSPQQAITAPRIHHQWRPDELVVERNFPAQLKKALIAKGHKLKVVEQIGISQIVARNPQTGFFTGAADPRGNGKAAGW